MLKLTGGSLLLYLRSEGQKQPSEITWSQLMKMCLDVASGMVYLEQRGFIHRYQTQLHKHNSDQKINDKDF